MSSSLTVVGTGITAISQLTLEAEHCLCNADKVFYLVTDKETEELIKKLNVSSESLIGYYGVGKQRLQTYMEMVDAMLKPVREGKSVCAAFYGHPGVFVYPSHEAIVQARKEGYPAKMLPAVSTEDIMIADLGVDPGQSGFQTYEATAFLLCAPVYDPRVPLVLWQVGVIGQTTHEVHLKNERLQILADNLTVVYGEKHNIILYQASPYGNVAPRIHRCTLGELGAQTINAVTTMYIPPKEILKVDHAMEKVMGVNAGEFSMSKSKMIRLPTEPYGITFPEQKGYVTFVGDSDIVRG